mgnify:CR=1 FL=1
MKITLSRLFSLLLLLLYVIMWFPTHIFPICSYADELLTLILFPILLLGYKDLSEKRLFIVNLIFFLLIGVVSTVLAHLHRPLVAVLTDFYVFVKLPVVYLFFRELLKKEEAEFLLNTLYKVSKIVIIISSIFCLLNYIFDIGMTYDIRYGIRSYKFIYNNPGFFSGLMVTCYCLINFQDNKNDLKYKLLAIFNIISSLRSVSFGVIALLIFMLLLVRKKLSLYHILMVTPMIMIASKNSFDMYFGDVVTPRKLLFEGGKSVFYEYFPLGSGFASYGSNAAHEYYSPLYLKFGFQYVWGLSRKFGFIANDNFWPMIFAQFGFIGTIFYVLMFLGILKDLFIISIRKNELISLILIIGYLLFSSVGSNVITGVLGVSMIVVYSSIVNVVCNER